MKSIWFWINWLKDFRWIWYSLAFIFIFSFAFLWFSYSQQADGIIHWGKIQEQKLVESTVHSFHLGPFELLVPAEGYVIIEYFQGSPIEINQIASILFVLVLVVSANILLAVITTLERFWYFTGMALFTLFVISLRIEVLALFMQRNQIPGITILAVFAFFSYYFQAVKSSVLFKNRLICFFALSLLTGVIIHFYAGVPFPALHLAVTGYAAGIVISIIFILMVAHEIPAAFVYVASQGNSKSLRHFSIVSVIYFFNVIVTCLHEVDVIHWNFIYLNPFALLSISAVLGVWGFKLREPVYEKIISFAPYGIFLFISLGSICLATIGYLLGSYNDPALRIIRYAIIFSHTGYGVIFLTYVFSNFILMLAQNLPVHKILYKPNRMPYFTFRLAGLIMTLAFVFYSNWKQLIYNGIAGFYNNMGDLYELMDKSTLAEAYYIQGSHYGYENNHSNYALGVKHGSEFDFDKAHHDYLLANFKQPTPYSLVNNGNLYIWENKFFESIEAFHKINKTIPNVGEVQNNLAFAYAKVHNLDSVLFYLDKALQYKNSRPTAETNFFATTVLEILPIKCDSVLKTLGDANSATLANALALCNAQKQTFTTKVDALSSSRLTLYTATLLNNYILYYAKKIDSASLNRAFKIASDSSNIDYRESLKFALAFPYYHQGNVSKALSILGELVYLSQTHQGKYNYIMGLWALEQRSPALASSYFDYSASSNYKDAKLYNAIALTEAQHIDEALIAWDTVAHGKDQNAKQMAEQMKRILNVTTKEALTLSDPEKYQFCRYKITISDTLNFNAILKTFSDDNYKAQALLDVTLKQFDWGNLKTAIRYFNQIGGLKLTDKTLYQNIKHTELLMLANRKELKKLASQINDDVDFTNDRQLEKTYYTALFNEAAGDTLLATRNFEIVGTYNPYFEEGIIAAASYFKQHGKDNMKSYKLLAEAIQLNTESPKLLKAYIDEASRMGFDDFAASTSLRLNALYKRK